MKAKKDKKKFNTIIQRDRSVVVNRWHWSRNE